MCTALRCTLLVFALVAGSASAQTTDLVAKKLTFDPLPRVDRGGRVGLEVTNSGTRASGSFTVRFTIRFQGNAVYEQTVSAPSILAEGAVNVWTPYTFTPTSQGIHDATAEIVYSGETDPSDNMLNGTCNPLAGYAPRNTAVARLHQLLTLTPQRNTLAAFHITPSDQQDSVHDVGTIITYLEGRTDTLTTPSYVFLIDLEPSAFFGHGVKAVYIPAERNSIEPIIERTTSVPFAVDGQPVNPGPWCGANPNRVIGDSARCTEVVPNSTLTTQNTGTCVLVFSGVQIRDVDDVTMRHDIARYVTRLNSDPKGPQITFGSFRVRRGTGSAGITRKQLSDELSVFKSAGCQKLIIKYVGHASPDGMLLSGMGFNGAEVLRWEDLAAMLDSLGASDVTIDITSNFAGRMREALRTRAILGTCIVSADKDSTMRTGGGEGTYWERAQTEAMASATADIDGDGVVGVTEAAQWVIANLPADDSARLPRPTVSDLTSPLRETTSSLDGTTDEAWYLPARGGTLTVSMERYRVSTTFKDGSTRRPMLVEGGNLYVDNLTKSTLRADAVYDFVIVRGRGSERTDSLVARLRPQVDAGQRIRIAAIPPGWSGLIIQKAPLTGPTVIIDSGQVVDHITTMHTVSHPKRYRSSFELADRGDGRTYDVTSSVLGAVNNDVDLSATVTTNALQPTRITIQGSMSDNRQSGGGVVATFTDRATTARTMLNIVLLQPLSADSQNMLSSSLAWNDVAISSGTHTIGTLNRSFIRLDPTASVSPHSEGMQINGSVIESPTLTTQPIAWGSADVGSMQIGGLLVTGFTKPTITHRDLIVRTMRFGDAALTLKPQPGKHDVCFVGLYGSRGDALTVDCSGDVKTYTIMGLDIVKPDNFDVRVTGGGTMHCVDCNISLQNSIASGGSAIQLRQTVSAIVMDAEGNPRQGAVVDVVGRTGTVLASGVTDDEGYVVIDTVLVGTTTTKVVDHRPIAVRLTNGDGTTQSEGVSASYWTQVMFRDSSTVGVNEERRQPTTVMPMPLTSTSAAVVVDDRGILGIEVLTLAGERVLAQTGTGLARLPLDLHDMAAGVYVLVVTTPVGRSTVPLIIQ